jgi:hypothetical protein
MTLPDRITHCDDCGWTGEVRETCPECELEERISAADSREIWDHTCELAEILSTSLLLLPDTDKASWALRSWERTKNAIIDP